MLLQELHLKNFGNVLDEKINFNIGIHVFSGKNGEGKSHFMKALALLLFNKTILKLEDYVRWGEKSFFISVKFIHDRKQFEISLKYNGTTERILIIEGEKEPYMGQDAINKLKEYFEPKLALASMMAFEGEIDLISITDSERREMCRKIFDLDFTYELDKLAKDKQEAQKQLDYVDNEIQHLENKEYKPVLKQRLPYSSDTYVNHKEQLKQYRKEREKVLIEAEQVRNIGDNISKTEKEISSNRDRISSFEQVLFDLSLKIEAEKQTDISSLFEAKRDLLIAGIEKEIEGKRLKLKQAEESLTHIEDEPEGIISELTGKVAEFEKEVLSCTSKIATAQATLDKLNNDRDRVIAGKCPTCGRPFDSGMIEAIGHQIIAVEQEIKSLDDDFGRFTHDKNNCKQKIIAYEQTVSLRKEILADIDSLTKDIGRLYQDKDTQLQTINEAEEEKIKSSKELIATWNESITEYKKMIDMEAEGVTELERELEKLKDSIPVELPDPSVFDTLISDLEKLIDEYEAIIVANSKAEEINKRIREEKEKDTDQLAEYEVRRAELSADIIFTEKAVTVLKRDFPSYVLGKIVKSLEISVNKFLGNTYDGKYIVKMKSSNTGLKIVYGPKEKDVRLASGYERQVFSMAYKYAMGKVNDYKVLALDEVDSAACDENSIKFYQTVGDMKNLYNQVLVITHKEVIKELLEKDYSATIFCLENGAITN